MQAKWIKLDLRSMMVKPNFENFQTNYIVNMVRQEMLDKETGCNYNLL